MTYTSYDIVSHYLDTLALLNKVGVETLFNSDIKKCVIKSIRTTELKIELYGRFFDVDIKEPNILKLLYFCAKSLETYLKAIYKQDIKKLMLLLMQSYLKEFYKIQNNITNDFFDRTCKKIEQAIIFDKEKDIYGEYGIYTIFISLVRFKSSFEVSDNAPYQEYKDIKTEIKQNMPVKSYILYHQDDEISTDEVNSTFTMIKGYMIGSKNSLKRIYKVKDAKLEGVYKAKMIESGSASCIIKKYSQSYNDNVVSKYVEKYAYNNLYVYELDAMKLCKKPLELTIKQINSTFMELSEEEVKKLDNLLNEQ